MGPEIFSSAYRIINEEDDDNDYKAQARMTAEFLPGTTRSLHKRAALWPASGSLLLRPTLRVRALCALLVSTNPL